MVFLAFVVDIHFMKLLSACFFQKVIAITHMKNTHPFLWGRGMGMEEGIDCSCVQFWTPKSPIESILRLIHWSFLSALAPSSGYQPIELVHIVKITGALPPPKNISMQSDLELCSEHGHMQTPSHGLTVLTCVRRVNSEVSLWNIWPSACKYGLAFFTSCGSSLHQLRGFSFSVFLPTCWGILFFCSFS